MTGPTGSGGAPKKSTRNMKNGESRNSQENDQIIPLPIVATFKVEKSYADVTLNANVPDKNQGLICDCEDELKLEDYVVAVGDIVQPDNVHYAARVAKNRIGIFLSSKELVDNFTDTYQTITIKNKQVRVRPYAIKHKKVTFSNVVPLIPNSALLQYLDFLQVRKSGDITIMNAGIKDDRYKHVSGYRRQVYVNADDLSKIPPVTRFTFGDDTYTIFASTSETVICFSCSEIGHMTWNCPKNTNKNSQEEITDQYSPELDANENRRHQPMIQTNNSQSENKQIREPAAPSSQSISPNLNRDSGIYEPIFTNLQAKRGHSEVSSDTGNNLTESDMKANENQSTFDLEIITPIEENSNMKEEMAKSLQMRPPSPNTTKATKKNRKKVKTGITKSLDTVLEPIKEKIDNSNVISYTALINFLESSKGVTLINPILRRHTEDPAKLYHLMLETYNDLQDRAIKSRFTSVMKKIKAENKISESSTLPPSDSEYTSEDQSNTEKE